MPALASLHPAAQREIRRWRDSATAYLDGQPTICAHVLARAGAFDRTDYRSGNLEVTRAVTALKRARVSHAFTETQLIACAESYARICARMTLLENRLAFAEWHRIDAPAGHGVTAAGAMLRLEDPLWWRRQLRKVWTRASEDEVRRLGLVRRGKAVYVSDENLKRRRVQKDQLHGWLERHDMVQEGTDERLALEYLAAHSLANPDNRLGELMVRVRGFEEIAKGLQHEAIFVTLTCPSAFHPQLAAGGENPAYDGQSTVRDAQAWLCKMWARARAKLHRQGIKPYGFRVAEPHHDGTPHWHVLLFLRAHEIPAVREVLRARYLSEFADEPGAREHRISIEAIDPAKGTPCGYLAKYMSKNIQAKGAIGDERSDEHEGNVRSSTGRVDAWASTYGIRQFQQIGGTPVGLYRETRRLRDPVADPDLERFRYFADRGRVGRFIQSLGGVRVGRHTNLKLERCERGDCNRYTEARPAQVIGVRHGAFLALTRSPHRWRVERKAVLAQPQRMKAAARRVRSGSSPLFSDLGPVALTVREASQHSESAVSDRHQAPPARAGPAVYSGAGP
jgi:hypothetical protein